MKWRSPEPRDFEDTFTGQTSAANSAITTWTVEWDSKTRGGDEILLSIKADAGGRTFKKEVVNPFSVIGVNPTVEQVKEGLTLEEQVIVYMESQPKWKHFNGGGMPIFGGPHGYGLMQLDNPRATDEQVWNWRANRTAGQRLFDRKLQLSRGYSQRINKGTTWYWKDKRRTIRVYNDPVDWTWYPIAYSDAQLLTEGESLLKEAFQRYNGGIYWRWRAERPKDKNSPGRWEATTGRFYGERAWSIYNQILNHGTYPPGWD